MNKDLKKDLEQALVHHKLIHRYVWLIKQILITPVNRDIWDQYFAEYLNIGEKLNKLGVHVHDDKYSRHNDKN